MLSVKIFRSLFAVVFACVITLNGFVSPAFAADDSVSLFINGFWYALGGVVGAATGTLATCYAVDVLIAPFAPPVAAYLATTCPAIGTAVGASGGVAVANKIAGAH